MELNTKWVIPLPVTSTVCNATVPPEALRSAKRYSVRLKWKDVFLSFLTDTVVPSNISAVSFTTFSIKFSVK